MSPLPSSISTILINRPLWSRPFPSIAASPIGNTKSGLLCREHQINKNYRPGSAQQDSSDDACGAYAILSSRPSPPICQKRRAPYHEHDINGKSPQDRQSIQGFHVSFADDIESDIGSGIWAFQREIGAHVCEAEIAGLTGKKKRPPERRETCTCVAEVVV